MREPDAGLKTEETVRPGRQILNQHESRYLSRSILLAASMIATFGGLRIALSVRPDADFNVAGYNIHHLFTGLLLITACAVPLAVAPLRARTRNILIAGLGIGLGLALDEWVYLIATDGSNAAYLTPVSFWGGLVVTGAAAIYALVVGRAAGDG